MLVFDLIDGLENLKSLKPEYTDYLDQLMGLLQPLAEETERAELLIPSAPVQEREPVEGVSVAELIKSCDRVLDGLAQIVPPPPVQTGFWQQRMNHWLLRWLFPTYLFGTYTLDPADHKRLIDEEIGNFRDDLKGLAEKKEAKQTSRFYQRFKANFTAEFSQTYFASAKPGQCYGMSIAYAHWYAHGRREGKSFSFSATMTRHHKGQMLKVDPHRRWHLHNLSRMRYLPGGKRQASFLIRQANQYPGQNLAISSLYSDGGHSTFLRQDGGKYHFMDPNLGAFDFASSEDFKAFYVSTLQHMPRQPHSLQMHLIADQAPKPSLMGAWRALMSPPSNHTSSNRLLGLVWVGIMVPILIGLLGSLAVALSLTGFSLAFPLMTPVSIALIAAPLLVGAGFALMGEAVYIACLNYNFHGLLAPLYLLDYGIRSGIGWLAHHARQLYQVLPFFRKASSPESVSVSPVTPETSSSSAYITSQLGGAGLSAGRIDCERTGPTPSASGSDSCGIRPAALFVPSSDYYPNTEAPRAGL